MLVGSFEEVTPRSPIRCLPKGVTCSRRSGTAVRVTVGPFRSTSKVRSASALALTQRCMSEKLSIRRPLIDTTRSLGWKPARSAALPAWTLSIRGSRTMRPLT